MIGGILIMRETQGIIIPFVHLSQSEPARPV